jgi:hypothetical protein
MLRKYFPKSTDLGLISDHRRERSPTSSTTVRTDALVTGHRGTSWHETHPPHDELIGNDR